MHAVKHSRYGVTMQNGTEQTYDALRFAWRCVDCGGVPVHRATSDQDTGIFTDWAECGRCGGRDFEKLSTIRNQQIDAVLVIEGLPMELQQALLKAQQEQSTLTDEDHQAAADVLY